MVNRAEDALIDVRVRLAVPFVAGVASTREASRCVGAVCINGTVIRPHGAHIDVLSWSPLVWTGAFSRK